jgi:uncharacterized membrane protein YdjX (TVP38/TMEM64 family)
VSEPAPSIPPIDPRARRRAIARLVVLALLILTAFIVARATGLTRHLTAVEIHALVDRSGPWGVLLFVGVFSLGNLMHVPGLAFVWAAVLAWGHARGGAYAYLGSLCAVMVSFLIVRAIGGRPFDQIRNRRVQLLLARVDTHPILTVAAIRAVLLAAPWTNYLLALSPISWRAYLLGSALGLIPSVTVTSLFFGYFV